MVPAAAKKRSCRQRGQDQGTALDQTAARSQIVPSPLAKDLRGRGLNTSTALALPVPQGHWRLKDGERSGGKVKKGLKGY